MPKKKTESRGKSGVVAAKTFPVSCDHFFRILCFVYGNMYVASVIFLSYSVCVLEDRIRKNSIHGQDPITLFNKFIRKDSRDSYII